MGKSHRALVKTWLACSVAVLAFLLTGPAFAEVVKNVSPAFQITIPDGFQTVKGLPKEEDVVFTYRREGLTQKDVGVVIQAIRHREKIGRDDEPGAEELAKGAKQGLKGMTIEKAPWHGEQICIVRSTATTDGREVSVWIAAVPLGPGWLSLDVLTEASDEASGRAVLTDLLASLDGKAEWRERSSSYNVEGLAHDALRLLILLAIVAALVSAVRRRRRGHPAAAAFDIPPGGSRAPSMAPGASFAPRGMPSVAPGSVKCAKCGLVAFATAGSTCRRCGTPT